MDDPDSNGDLPARARLRAKHAPYYEPSELAEAMFDRLEQMEIESNQRPEYNKYRSRTGLICTPEFRGVADRGRVEDSITEWLAEFFPNAESQVADIVQTGERPDIVLSYERDRHAEDVFVIVEAKPLWHRWITTGERVYTDVCTDAYGRSTGPYLNNNVRQIVSDRNKLLRAYRDQRDRHLLLGLTFQRPGEVDDRVVDAIGPNWLHASRHIVDLCNPPGDNIGLTAMIFWPARN